MYDELVKRLREAAKISDALAVLLPHSEGNATAKLYNEAADAIEKLQGKHYLMKKTAEWLAEKVPRWIPVTERLPEYGKHVLVYAGFFQPYIEAAYYCEDRKWRFTYDDAEVVGVTHWMPLPEPPKEET